MKGRKKDRVTEWLRKRTNVCQKDEEGMLEGKKKERKDEEKNEIRKERMKVWQDERNKNGEWKKRITEFLKTKWIDGKEERNN